MCIVQHIALTNKFLPSFSTNMCIKSVLKYKYNVPVIGMSKHVNTQEKMADILIIIIVSGNGKETGLRLREILTLCVIGVLTTTI